MSQFHDLPVIGVDVAADFSVATILSPNGDAVKKNFHFIHTFDGFESFLQLIKNLKKSLTASPKYFADRRVFTI